MKRLKKRWYAFTLISIIAALVVMVVYNYTAFRSNVIANTEDIGSGNLAQITEALSKRLRLPWTI